MEVRFLSETPCAVRLVERRLPFKQLRRGSIPLRRATSVNRRKCRLKSWGISASGNTVALQATFRGSIPRSSTNGDYGRVQNG